MFYTHGQCYKSRRNMFIILKAYRAARLHVAVQLVMQRNLYRYTLRNVG